VIRPAGPPDVEVIVDIQRRGWWAAYGGFVEHAKMAAAQPRAAARWRQRLADPSSQTETWVAEEDGAVHGWVTAGASRDDDARPGDGELLAIYVDPDAVRRGVGGMLLAHGEARLRQRGYHGATLWVFVENTGARTFYERRGWMLDQRPGRDPWSDWGPSVRYRKELG
jgi:ribosomal protein S18 acetylase RimI-like enzyme